MHSWATMQEDAPTAQEYHDILRAELDSDKNQKLSSLFQSVLEALSQDIINENCERPQHTLYKILIEDSISSTQPADVLQSGEKIVPRNALRSRSSHVEVSSDPSGNIAETEGKELRGEWEGMFGPEIVDNNAQTM